MAQMKITTMEELGKALDGKTDEQINKDLEGEYAQNVRVAVHCHGRPLPPRRKPAPLPAVIQYDVARRRTACTRSSSKWHEGKCTVVKGSGGPARVTLSLSLPDFLRLVANKLDGMQAFLGGKLKLAGDMMFAQTAQGWFKRG